MYAAAHPRDGSAGVPLSKLILGPAAGFIKHYFLRKGFRDGLAGLVASALSSFYVFLKYAKQLEQASSKREETP